MKDCRSALRDRHAHRPADLRRRRPARRVDRDSALRPGRGPHGARARGLRLPRARGLPVLQDPGLDVARPKSSRAHAAVMEAARTALRRTGDRRDEHGRDRHRVRREQGHDLPPLAQQGRALPRGDGRAARLRGRAARRRQRGPADGPAGGDGPSPARRIRGRARPDPAALHGLRGAQSRLRQGVADDRARTPADAADTGAAARDPARRTAGRAQPRLRDRAAAGAAAVLVHPEADDPAGPDRLRPGAARRHVPPVAGLRESRDTDGRCRPAAAAETVRGTDA